jgi:hypothetical protein
MTRTNLVITAALALAVTLPAVSAHAQSPRTFVSAAGSDSNPCTFAAPCRHFQAAVNATTLGGEVDALDPAGYGPITINHAITIEGQGWSYVASPNNGAAITINAGSSDNINIHGLSLNGVGTTNSSGIAFNTGGALRVQNSFIRGFSVAGVLFEPTASSTLFVSDTLVSDSTYGIRVLPTGSAALAQVTLNRDELSNNATGFIADATVGDSSGIAVDATIINTVVANNSNIGVGANSDVGTANIEITGSSIINNGTGLFAGGDFTAFSRITIGLSTIKNSISLSRCSICPINSFGTNMLLPLSPAPNNSLGPE